MVDFRELPTFDSPDTRLIHEQNNVSLTSPAAEIFTPIAHLTYGFIEPGTSIDDALLLLNKRQFKDWVFIGSNDRILGAVNRMILMSRNVLMVANKKGVTRQDLCVEDLMSHAKAFPCIQHSLITTARVGDIKMTMQQSHEPIVLVVDENNVITGMFLSTTINRIAGEAINIVPTVHSFKDCFEVFHEHRELM